MSWIIAASIPVSTPRSAEAQAVILTVSDQTTDPTPGLILIWALVVGPSLGHFYADRPAAWNNNSGGSELMLAGLALGGTVLAWDIIAAPRSARVHNAKVRLNRVAIGLIPSYQTPGVRLRARISF